MWREQGSDWRVTGSLSLTVCVYAESGSSAGKDRSRSHPFELLPRASASASQRQRERLLLSPSLPFELHAFCGKHISTLSLSLSLSLSRAYVEGSECVGQTLPPAFLAVRECKS